MKFPATYLVLDRGVATLGGHVLHHDGGSGRLAKMSLGRVFAERAERSLRWANWCFDGVVGSLRTSRRSFVVVRTSVGVAVLSEMSFEVVVGG